MIRADRRIGAVLVVAAALLGGCGGDLGQQVMGNPAIQQKVMGMIAANSGTAGQMVDQLLASDSARVVLVDKLLASPHGSEASLGHVASHTTLLDGVLTRAMQDPAMKDHVLTLFKGMQMAAGK